MSDEDKDDRPVQEQVAKESETDVKRKRKRKRSRKKKKGQEDDGEDSLDSSSRTVYVEGISYDASEEDLEKHFGSACSSIKDIRMPRWQDSGKPRGYAHIDFDTVEDVRKALKLNVKDALSKGVFGVPSFVIDNELFWGNDSIPYVESYLEEEDNLNSNIY